MMSHRILHISVSLAILVLSTPLFSAAQTADKILAIVGRNHIILQSELEGALTQSVQGGMDITEEMKCQMLQQMILQKMLVEQAARDSVIVTDEEVEGSLDNKIRYYVSLFGSKEKMEQNAGKTVYQLKEENRDAVRESMTAEKMQGQIMQHIKITPAEVQTFYKSIPVDSLPFFPAMVEMGQIVIGPDVSPELEEYARKKLEGIRSHIVNDSASFEAQATIYSEDPGSRDNNGDLGVINRKDVVPEFAAAAFKLQNGEISPIVKTKFGYHIIQMVKRQGEDAHLRHILVKPQYTTADYDKALRKLDSVRAELVSGKITFQEAVGKYATDEMSKRTGGMIVDLQSGATQMDIDKLDPALALMIDNLKPGEFSQPQIFDQPGGEKSCRIVYMKNITTPHKANLKDDYSKIQEVALQHKKSQQMEKWVNEKLPSYYVKLDPAFKECTNIKNWDNSDKK